MGKVNRPDSLLSELRALQRRVAQLETQQRLTAARISSGQLIVGAHDADDQIEIDATNSRIRFDTDGEAPTDLRSWGGAGAALVATNTVGSVAARTLTWNGGYFATSQISRINPDGSTSVAAEIYADVQDAGSGQHSGTVTLIASGSNADGSIVDVNTDGGMLLRTGGRTTDPPAPPADCVLLYVKSNRLYYRDGAGVVRGPL
ncbi:hypothetical protein [Actinomadura sp. DC4]|uniref:hypothetical protein n=1 Tax=Actinomadura sp. DC4 TaxID=3055069 RepID=UPI0025B209BE|nr:hypothetical protein [Actinomadura sp. DC4]MDN3356091.1 hypothetical protein [Actinomadura sp. DC4]